MLSAVTVGAEAATLLRVSTGEVHGIYDDAVNVTIEDNRMVSVVRTEVGNGPVNVVTDMSPASGFGSFLLTPGDRVFVREGSLLLGRGKLSISLIRARLYESRRELPRGLSPHATIEENARVLGSLVRNIGRNGSLGELVEQFKGVDHPLVVPRGSNPFSRAAVDPLNDFILAVQDKDFALVAEAASNLVGLGAGLTPSADDLLAGVMLTLRLGSSREKELTSSVARLCAAVASRVRGRTTRLSGELLRQAAEGRGAERLTDLIEEVLTGRGGALKQKASIVLSAGGTSGTDTALGIWLGSLLLIELLRGVH